MKTRAVPDISPEDEKILGLLANEIESGILFNRPKPCPPLAMVSDPPPEDRLTLTT